MISKKHVTKSLVTILSTLTFLTAVSPCTFAEEKIFNRKTAGPMSTTSKIFLAGAGAIGLAVVIGGAVYGFSNYATAELLKAIEDNDVKKAKEILDRYHKIIDLEIIDLDSLTKRAHSDDMIYLIKAYKCKVNATDNKGHTPLHEAALVGSKEACEVLIKRGAKVNATDNKGHTPLHEAALVDSKEACEVLIKNGADVNAKDNYGQTPLHESAWFICEKVCEVLIKNGADVNAKDNDGRTPLYIAALLDREKACKVLIDNHADVNAKANDDKTPLDVASTDEIKQLLLGHGAKYGN